MNQKTLVSIVKGDYDSIETAVNRSIDLINGLDDLKGKKVVSIKPNLCNLGSSYTGSTTDPRIVEAIIKKLNSIVKCEIQIVETNTAKANADRTFRELGYLDLSKRYRNVKCVNLSKDTKLRINFDGEIFKTAQVAESMLFSQYLINVAKLKTHADYRYTGILKNAYGFLSSPSRRAGYHGFMHKALVDLNRFFKPDLSIIDAVVGMEGFGPVDGKPKYIGAIIASKDPVAADTIASKIIGINPSKIKYLKYAERKGLGKTDDIKVVGCSVEELKTNFDFIPMKWYYLGLLSLSIQRWSRRLSNLARLFSLGRSAMSAFGYSDLNRRFSIFDMIRLARDVFKINE